MKKVLSVFIAMILFAVPSFAAAYNPSQRVPEIGEKLLTKNGIPSSGIKFMTVSGNVDNSNYLTNKTVNVTTNDLTYTGNDNEVAAVVANELGHIISGHASKGKVFEMLKNSTNTNISTDTTTSTIASGLKTLAEEKEADIIAVNMTVAAGYNPLALIVVLTKQTGTYWETIQGKPANAERAMNIFDYISLVYPEKIKAGYGCNEYRNFLAYANAEINNRNKKEKNRVSKLQNKNKKNSINQLTKFKTRGGMSGWDAAFGILKETGR